MEYLIHCVLNRSNLISCKLLALYSTLKRRLGPNFSQFIHGFKIGIFGWTSQFFPIQEKKMEKHKPRLYFQIIPNSLKNWEG